MLYIPLQAAQHPVQLRLLLLIELTANPGQGREHRVGKPVTPNLNASISVYLMWILGFPPEAPLPQEQHQQSCQAAGEGSLQTPRGNSPGLPGSGEGIWHWPI